jgi:hypothetical protein
MGAMFDRRPGQYRCHIARNWLQRVQKKMGDFGAFGRGLKLDKEPRQ